MSNSLPGLARFGCDLSATVGGIPNFGQKSQSREQAIATRERSEGRAPAQVIAAAPGQGDGLAFRPVRAVFVNQSDSLGLIHVLDPCLRRWPIGHSPARGIRRAAIQVPRERALSANGHADRDFECVPVWRFGNSRAGPERETDRIADSYLRLSGNLPLGHFGPPWLP